MLIIKQLFLFNFQRKIYLKIQKAERKLLLIRNVVSFSLNCLKAVLSLEVHMCIYAHMQKLLAKKNVLGRFCIKLPHFVGCCGNRLALWKCKTMLECNAKTIHSMKEKNSWELRQCKLTCQTVARQSEPGAVWKKKRWGLGKQLNTVNRINKTAQLFSIIAAKKIQGNPGMRI